MLYYTVYILIKTIFYILTVALYDVQFHLIVLVDRFHEFCNKLLRYFSLDNYGQAMIYQCFDDGACVHITLVL